MIAVPLKSCCPILLGEECDCARFAAEVAAVLAAPAALVLRPDTGSAAAEPSASFPTPIVLRNVGGLMRRVQPDTHHLELPR